MADSELLMKLKKQQKKIVDANGGGDAAGGLDQNIQNVPGSNQLAAQHAAGLSSSNQSVNSTHSSTNRSRSSSIAAADGGHSDELMNRLARRQDLNDGRPVDAPYVKGLSMYQEFQMFSRKTIKFLQETFHKYDLDSDGFLCFSELKLMMEKLGAPQTHLALKEMIRVVDEDQDSMISLREFMLIFRKAADGELLAESGLSELCRLTEIDVHNEGVIGAKHFFEAKIDLQTRDHSLAAEIRQEQEEKRREEEQKQQRRAQFLAKQQTFNTNN